MVVVKSRQTLLHHTTNEWASEPASGLALLNGEVGVALQDGKVVGFKFGDGEKTWSELSYCLMVRGQGVDSLIQVTDPSNPDHTMNTCLGAYSAGFGDRNSIGQYASECLVAGGNIVQEGQNGFSWGYRCENYANQTQVGGYKVYSYSSESLLIGNQVQAGVPGDIDITIDPETGEVDISSLSRYNVILGNKMFFGTETKFVFAFGQEVRRSGTTPIIGAKHGVFLCSGSRVRDNTEFIYAIGHNAFIGDDSENIVVLGEHPLVIKQSDGAKHVYLIGRYNRNANVTEDYTGTSSTAHSYVFEFGECLIPTKDHQVLLGRYNGITSESPILMIGNGTSEDNRRTPFEFYDNEYTLPSTSTKVRSPELGIGELWLSDSYISTENKDFNPSKRGWSYVWDFGKENTIANNASKPYIDHTTLFCFGCIIGNHVSYINVFGGDRNNIGDYTVDSTIFGYWNSIPAGTNSSKNSNIYMFGNHLTAGRSQNQWIFGHDNADDPYAILIVGSGTHNSQHVVTGKNVFAIFEDHVYFPTYTTIGHFGATTKFVNDSITSVVGDINSALDVINGTVI